MASAPKKGRPAPQPVAAAPAPIEAPALPVEAAALAVEAPALPVEAAATPEPVVAPVGSAPSIFEKGLAEAKQAADAAAAALELSYGAARNGVLAFNVRAIEALKADADASLDFFKSLTSVTRFSDVVTLQSEFAKQRFEERSTHAKELAELARKVAKEATAPLTAHVSKTLKVAS